MHHVTIPVSSGRADKKAIFYECPMYDVHELLEYLWKDAGVIVELQALKDFWQHARAMKQPWALQHNPSELRIPIKIFGDDCKISPTEKVTCIFISCPLWRPTAARNSRFLVWPLRESLSLGTSAALICIVTHTYPLWVYAPSVQFPIPGHASLYPILRRLVWGMNIAYTLPTTHAAGFCCTEIGGDWKWMKQLWRFDASWLSHELCHLCDAKKMTYDNFAHSTWHSTAQFILKLPDPVCPLALLQGFDVTTIRWCQLHNVNLGLCWTANGSSLLYLIELGYFGDPQTELLSLLDIAFIDFKEFTRAGGWRHSQRKFTPKLIIKAGSGAYMTTKGWNARVITAWLANCSLMAFNGTIECFGSTSDCFYFMSWSCRRFEIRGWV